MSKGDKVVILTDIYNTSGFYRGTIYTFDSNQSPDMCAIENKAGRRFMVRKKDIMRVKDDESRSSEDN